MPDTCRRPPCSAVPVKPALGRVSLGVGQEPIQLLRIDFDAVRLKHHCRGSHRATRAAHRAVFFNAAKRIVAPPFVALTDRGPRQPEAMKKISAAPRCKGAFPVPINENARDCGEHEKKKNEK